MRRSPRLALALLLAATPVMAQEKATDTAARSFKVSWAAPCPDAVETQVCCEVKFIRVSDAMLKHLRFQSAPSAPQPNQRESATGLIRVGACCDAEAPDEKRRVQFASADEMKKLMEQLQQDARTTVIAAPKVTMLSGEPATIQTLEQHPCVGDLGMDASLTAVASADARKVKVVLDMRARELGEAVTPSMNAAASGGPDGKAVATTLSQFVQLPKVVTRGIKDTLVIADGQSVILYAGAAEHDVRREFRPPVISKIPYVNRLYKNVGYGKETDHLLVVLTPRIIKEDSCCADKCKAATATAPVKLLGDNQLNLLLKAYHEACADNRPDDARRLAIECLALDPTCFGKK